MVRALKNAPHIKSLKFVEADAGQVSESEKELLLNVGPGLSLVAHQQYAYKNKDGTSVWYGLFESDAQLQRRLQINGESETIDNPLNSVMIVRNGNKLTGTIRAGGKLYSLKPLASGGHVIAEIDEARMPPDHPLDAALVAAGAGAQETAADVAVADVAADGNTVVRVMVVITQASADAIGDVGGFVNLAIAESNQGFVNSGVFVKYQLAGWYLTNYVTAGFNTDLDRFSGTSDGYLDNFHSIRDDIGADLNVLIISDTTYCGMGYLNADASKAFSAVYHGCATGNYTFAHETGHNFGAHHDPANGSNPDYAYGYGYQYPAGGWRTLMAYACTPPATCSKVNYWSNPNITYQGVPMGAVGKNDNHRLLNERRAVVAAFRGDASPQRVDFNADFNADGYADILWRNDSTGSNSIWRSANSATPTSVAAVADQAWKVVGVGDFNGDGFSDILWRHNTSGSNWIWKSGSSATAQALTAVTSPAWRVVGIGDFDRDGISDVLWRNAGTGANVIWRSADYATQTGVATVADQAWKVVGIGDFNGDGRSDILWRHDKSGANWIWKSGSSATAQVLTPVTSPVWRVVGIGDFDGDGNSDVLWRDTGTGANVIWRSANYATSIAVTAIADQAWKVEEVADFNHDGKADILWRNSTNGANEIWRSGSSATKQAVTAVGTSWNVVP
jgi:hypothetical protein